MTAYEVATVPGLPEVGRGDDLAALVTQRWPVQHGDIFVVTSKVVSKAEGRVVCGDRETAIDAETDRVVASRGATRIVRTRHGLVMAAAGVDASNTAPGTLVLLPEDADRAARRLRQRFRELTGAGVAVLVTDTSGRAWRTGQTDVAIGVAGIQPLDDHAGRRDAFGNPLAVTAPAVADELAGAGDVAKGKLGGTPVAVVRGLGHLVLPADDHGPGAAALVRPESSDMFGLGAREAVVAALQGRDARGFGGPAPAEELVAALRAVLADTAEPRLDGSAVRLVPRTEDPYERGRVEARAEALAAAYGWHADGVAGALRGFRPRLP